MFKEKFQAFRGFKACSKLSHENHLVPDGYADQGINHFPF